MLDLNRMIYLYLLSMTLKDIINTTLHYITTRTKIKKYKKHRKTSFLLRRDCHASI